MFEDFYDSHIHSRHSHDGSDSVDRMCEAAVRRGIKGIAFTDHCDIGSGRTACEEVKRGLLRDVRLARGRFGESLIVAMGLELGEPHHDPALAREIADDPDIDFLIGSLHRLRGEKDFYYIDYDRADLHSLMARYYDELEELASLDCFDVLGHVNYQLRYMRRAAAVTFDLSRYRERLRTIFGILAQSGRGIEVNTSGLRRKLNDTLPSLDVIRLFREAGGRVVTIGSDSHDASTVGEGVPTARERLSSVGFGRFAFFMRRIPEMFPAAVRAVEEAGVAVDSRPIDIDIDV